MNAVVQRLGISKDARFRGGDEYETARWSCDAMRGSNLLLAALVASSSRIGLPLNLLLDGPPVVRVADIQKVVARKFGIEPFDMVSDRRNREVAWPRQLAMYLSRELTRFSLPTIGRLFGGRDHTTVIHALRQVEKRMDGDADFAETVAELCVVLKPQNKPPVIAGETLLEAA